MNSPTVGTFFDAFLARLGTNRAARRLWTGARPWTNPDWTKVTTAALAEASSDIADAKLHVSAKAYPDTYGRREYMTLDLMAYDNSSWGPPHLIVEHENSTSEYKLQYCAWKLLCTTASNRVLVAYIDSRETGRYRGSLKSTDTLRALLAPVKEAHPLHPLGLFVGDWGAALASNDWRSVYSVHEML